MQKLVLLMAIAPFAVAVGAASETVSFTSVDSQGGSGMVTYNANLAGGYTLGAIDWEGFATALQTYTYGSELRLDLSGPLGAGTITLGSGTSYYPGAAFGGSSNLFSGAGDPAGTWTFDFYESYDDGADGLPDATWDYIDFLFGDFAPPEPPDALLVDVPSVTTGASTSYEVEWFMFDIGTMLDMDINSFGSGYDTELGLYDDAGALLASNDDTGGLQSQILATLDAGTYYVALGGYNTAYNPAWDAVGGYASGDYTLTITPEPGSLVLLALGFLALRRR